MIVKTFTWPDESATADFAARLVAQWRSLHPPLDMVLLLDGDLGADGAAHLRSLLVGDEVVDADAFAAAAQDAGLIQRIQMLRHIRLRGVDRRQHHRVGAGSRAVVSAVGTQDQHVESGLVGPRIRTVTKARRVRATRIVWILEDRAQQG